MNGIQIKCYLFPKDVKISVKNVNLASEIRRFAIDYNQSGLYNQLIEKIRAAYGNLIKPDEEIKTYWQDEENDLICFSSDDETVYAVDLQAAVRLSTHSMGSLLLKVYVSVKDPSKKAETPKTEESQLHPGIVCDECNGSIRGTRYTCTVCPDYDLCSACKNKGIHTEHDFIVFEKPVRQRCPYGGRNRGLFRGFHRQRCQAQCHNTEQTQQSEQPSTSSASTNPFAALFPFLPAVNDPEQLKTFGEFLKQFLDPFGIDVDYYVDSKDKKQEQPKKQETENPIEKETEKSQNSSFVNVEEKMETLIDFSASKTAEPNAKCPIENTEKTPSAPNKPVESTSIASAVSYLEEAIKKQSPIKFLNLSKSKETIEDVEENGSVEDIEDIEKELKYIKCVEQLKGMGYNDEAGWLTRLVIAKEGNINLVLDALQPSK